MEVHIFEEDLDSAYEKIIKEYKDKAQNATKKSNYIFIMTKILEEIGVVVDYEWN